jgi:hypothetical protein
MWLVAGGAAACLPILAHLLTLRRARRVEFPAARFVRAAIAADSRRTRPRDLILLTLRVLAIVCMGLAFADPVAAPRASGRAAPTALDGDTIIIIDASASMQRPRGGATVFEHARAEAGRMLGALDPMRDRAAVIVAAGRPEALLPRLTANFTALRRELSAAQPTLEFGDSQAALALAASLSDSEAGRPARVIVLSDFQASQWESVSAGIPFAAHRLEPDPGPAGASVDDIRISNPQAGVSARVAARVTNHDAIGRAVSVRVTSKGGSAATVVQLDAGETGVATLDLPAVQESAALVTVSVPEDAFPFDDARRVAVDVDRTPQAAVITASDPADFLRGSAWVCAALSAGGSGRAESMTSTLPPRDLSEAELRQFDPIIVVDGGALDEATIKAILGRLRNGGDAVWMLDSQASCGSLARLLRRAGRDAACAELGGPNDAALTIRDFRPANLPPALLGSASVVAPIPLPVGPQYTVASTFSDGSPFLAQVPIGEGELWIMRAAIAHDASDLVRSPLFPILLDSLIDSMRDGWTSPAAAHVGAPAMVAAPALVIADLPPDPRDSFGRPVSIDRSTRGVVVGFLPLAAPGVVTLNSPNGVALAIGAVNLDPRESDTARISDQALAALMAGDSDPERQGARLGYGLDDPETSPVALWPIAMVMALILLASESVVLLCSDVRGRDAAEDAP